MNVGRLTRTIAICCAAAAVLCVMPSASSAAVQLQGAKATYSYTLKWNPTTRLLTGHGRIMIFNLGPQTIDHVWLRLRPNDGETLMKVGQFTDSRVLERTADGSMVKVGLFAPRPPRTRAWFDFELRLRVPRENTSLGRSSGIDLFGDALPIIASDGPRGIRVGPEPSYGEGTFAPKTDWTVEIRVPKRLKVLMPAHAHFEHSPRGTRTYRVGIGARDFAFAIGRFNTFSRMSGDTRVVIAGNDSRAELARVFRRASNALTQMSRWYGDYNRYWLTVVVGDLPFGGSEYPGLVFSTPDNATIAHEVAHQWFYGLVGNDQYNDPFLDESLTAFAEQRFHKSYRCDLARPVKDPSHGLRVGMGYWQKHPSAYEDTIYRGGACALTVLRNEIGAAAFDNALRQYVDDNRNQIASVDDFLAAIRASAPAYDLAAWERLVGLV